MIHVSATFEGKTSVTGWPREQFTVEFNTGSAEDAAATVDKLRGLLVPPEEPATEPPPSQP